MSDLKLIEAVKADDYVMVEELIKSGADLNQQDEQGWTPLNFAAGKGDLSIVKLLIDNGADIFKSGRDQRTSYMIALAAGRLSVAKYLREAEERHLGDKPAYLSRKYCKAYHLEDLRKYTLWKEDRINWGKERNDTNGSANGDGDGPFPGDKVVFIHQDFTVTESM